MNKYPQTTAYLRQVVMWLLDGREYPVIPTIEDAKQEVVSSGGNWPELLDATTFRWRYNKDGRIDRALGELLASAGALGITPFDLFRVNVEVVKVRTVYRDRIVYRERKPKAEKRPAIRGSLVFK